MRIVLYVLLGIVIGLQYPLWLGDGGLLAMWKLRREIAAQQTENTRLQERNLALEAEVRDLKEGYEALEERARAELGMVRRGETFYQMIENPPKPTPETRAPAARR
jgi:cell division protein FtsB